MDESPERRVRERANECCEYCKIPAYISEFTFPLDHIVAQQHGSETTFEKRRPDRTWRAVLVGQLGDTVTIATTNLEQSNRYPRTGDQTQDKPRGPSGAAETLGRLSSQGKATHRSNHDLLRTVKWIGVREAGPPIHGSQALSRLGVTAAS
jgi:hypothetical protein